MPSLVRKRVSKRTGKVSWVGQVPIGKKPDGTTRYLVETFALKRDASSWVADIIRERDSGGVVEPAAMTVAEYLEHWLTTAVEPALRSNTAESYRTTVKTYLTPHVGDVRLKDLKPLHIQAAYTAIQKGGRSGRTVRYAHAVLRNALDQAVAWRMLARNPAAAGIKLPKQTRQEIQPLTADEAGEFIMIARTHRLGPLFETALVTGMRPGELLGLHWRDVDLASGSISIRRTLTWTREGWSLNEPKTARGNRTIPIPATTAGMVREWQATQATERMAAGTAWQGSANPRDGFVFTAPLGGPIERRNVVNRGFKPILTQYRQAQEQARVQADAGISTERIANDLGQPLPVIRRWIDADGLVPARLRMYDLRHTCATLMLLAGVNPKVVSERLGHASVVLTLDTYSHVLPNMQEDATARLAAVVYGSAPA